MSAIAAVMVLPITFVLAAAGAAWWQDRPSEVAVRYRHGRVRPHSHGCPVCCLAGRTMSRHDLTFRAWITRVDRYLGAHLATVTRWRIFRLWPLHLFVVVAAWDPKLLEAERAAELARWAKAEAGPSDDELLTAIRAVVSEWSATVEAQDSPWPDYQDPLAARDSFVRIVDLLDAEALS